MKEIPILFSAPMVRALLAGTKTQTRRVVKPQPPADGDRNCGYSAPVWGWTRNEMPSAEWHKVRCPYGQPGDRLWVREAWRSTGDGGRCDHMPPRDMQAHHVWYEVDGKAPQDECVGKLRRSMFMPRWASRITLEVTEVRVERLQDISDADAIAEGIESFTDFLPSGHWRRYDKATFNSYVSSPVDSYASLWESINGAGSWEANPWVWAVSFRRITP